MGTMTKIWLGAMTVITVLGSVFGFIFLVLDKHKEAMEIIHGGTGLLILMLFVLGFVHCMKYLADAE